MISRHKAVNTSLYLYDLYTKIWQDGVKSRKLYAVPNTQTKNRPDCNVYYQHFFWKKSQNLMAKYLSPGISIMLF